MPNSAYWKKRMEALEDANYQKGRAYMAHVDKQFRIAQQNIERQIEYWYARIADNNGLTMQGAKRLLRADELEDFKLSVEDYIKKGESLNYSDKWAQQLENASAKVHISRLEALKMQMQQECEVLYGNMADGLDDTLRSMYTSSYYNTAYEFMRGVGVGWAFNQLDTRRIERAINTVWATDGLRFSDRVWKNKEKLMQELNTVLVQNIIQGESPQKAIAQLSKRMNVSRSRAGTLIMTESAFIHSQSQRDCYHDLDVERYQFVATLDSRTSEVCQAMDGVIIDMKDYTIGVNVPPLHPNCRSCTIPYYEDNVGVRIARGADGKAEYVPSDITYKEWKRKYVDGDEKAYTQDDIDKMDGRIFDVDELFKDISNKSKAKAGYASNSPIVNPIKQADIDKVNLKNIPGLTNEKTIVLRDAHKRVLRTAKEQNMSMEVAILLDDDMKDIAVVLGTAEEIDLNIAGRSKAMYVIHNHPNNAGFSDKDLAWFIKNENTKYFSIVKNNGEIEMLFKRDDFDKEKFLIEFSRAVKKFQRDIDENVQKGYNKVVQTVLTKTKAGLEYLR